MTYFAALTAEPIDPILASFQAFAADTRPEKANLGVGMYYDAEGRIPVMAAVAAAERKLTAAGAPWGYLMTEGLAALRTGARDLVFGTAEDPALLARIATMQSLGGTGALRLGADLLRQMGPDARVALSTPSWSNHRGIFEAAGLSIIEYPYYDKATRGLDYPAMRAAIAAMEPGTVVVLHACCHNPTGVDLDAAQWQDLAGVLQERRLVPFLDMAYAGFGDGLQQDTAAARLLAATGLPLFVAISFSKNFSLYGERVGALCVVAGSAAEAGLVTERLKNAARTSYSTPPAHGAMLVAAVLSDPALRAEWEAELESMRLRIVSMRTGLLQRVGGNEGGGSFDNLVRQKGLFSYSGLNPDQMARLRDSYAVHAISDGRLCMAALNDSNLDRVAAGLRAVAAVAA